MNKLDPHAVETIRRWLYRNARPLELARWRYHFEGGAAQDVLRSLSMFQNEDGGFGHALDCDNWNPASTPYNVSIAFDVLRELGLFDASHPLVQNAFAFLDSGLYFDEHGWWFSIPSNSDHPHAPWWTYSKENNDYNGYHATGGLVGYILRCGDRQSRLYEKAHAIAKGMLGKLCQSVALEMHETGAYATLLYDLLAIEPVEGLDTASLQSRLRETIDAAIERDPAKWNAYSMRPTMYIPSPESVFYPGNEAALAAEMNFLVDSRNAEGVWNISWQWEAYPREFAISERWWQGYWAVRNMLFLRAYGRL